MSSRRETSRAARSSLAESRLRKRTDYRRCYERGRRRYGKYLTVHALENELAGPRLGITVTRRVGGAVVRNRVKRRVREIYRRWVAQPQLPALDIVVHAKPSVAQVSFGDLKADLERQLAGLLPGRGR